MNLQLQSFATSLYTLYSPIVRRYVHSRCRPPLDAEDVESDIWLHVCRGAHTFSGDTPSRWLLTIAHNRVVEAYRRQSMQQRLHPLSLDENSLDIPDSPVDIPADSPYPVVDWAVVLPQLRKRHREVMTLLSQGKTRQETADALGTTEGNVRIVIHRTKGKIRELVGSLPCR